ncbi:ribosomal RNA small subunit methyltransferase A, partial [Candidatus Saccharibacteria bacterium]|nr:ribosomal RNA small subunit methyltransferase A [Candidatus Saccharibacteria bacterium]
MKNNKSLGQHWLSDRRVLNEIADLAATTPTETCLEIGPGLGT